MATTSASACRAAWRPSPEPLPHCLLSTVLPRPLLSHTSRSWGLAGAFYDATHDCHETDFLDALHERWSQQNETAYELVYFDLGRKLDFFEVLLTFEHFRAGFFGAVPDCPESATAAQTSPHSDRESIR